MKFTDFSGSAVDFARLKYTHNRNSNRLSIEDVVTKRINEPFTSSLSSFWTQNKGTWSISANQANVDTLTSGEAVLLADSTLDIITYEAKVTFPASSSTNKVGIVFAHDGTNSYYAVVLNRNTSKLALYKITSGSWGSVLASVSATYNDSTQYTLKVIRRQSNVEAWVVGITATNLNYNSSTDLGTGKSGVYSDKTSVTFDDFAAIDGTANDPMVPRMGGTAEMFLTSGMLQVNDSTRGGVATVQKFTDGVYMVQVYIDRNGGDSDIWIHYQDPNNGYRIRFNYLDEIWVDKVVNGTWTNIAANAVAGGTLVTVGVKYLTGPNRIVVYKNGTQHISVNDSSLTSGGVALGGGTAKFDNLKVGYDNNSDNDLDDAGDDLAVNETFASGDTTIVYDKAGNLIDDGSSQFQYDAWNRLVKVRSAKTTNPTIQTAEFDGAGRRIKKVVTNSEGLNGTTVFFYDHNANIIETRDGSGEVIAQAIANPPSVLCIGRYFVIIPPDPCPPDPGKVPMLFIHHDAHGNPLVLTDLGGSVVERYVYSPYGEITVHQETGLGDYDGDRDVDSADRNAISGACNGSNPTGPCRILDFNGDGVVDSEDDDCFVQLPQGLARHPGLTTSGVGHSFLYQSLWYDPELRMYQNMKRQYDAAAKRFLQRAPLGRSSVAGADYPDGLNAYGYVRNNPVLLSDPSGSFVPSLVEGPTSVDITMSLVYWGAGASEMNVAASDFELNGSYVGGYNQPHYLKSGIKGYAGIWKPIRFMFPSVHLTQFVAGTTVCCHLLPHSCAPFENLAGQCAEEARTQSGMDISVWVRPPPPDNGCDPEADPPCLLRCDGGGRADVPTSFHPGTFRRVAVDGDLLGQQPYRLISHELGHIMLLTHPAQSNPCAGNLGHLMTNPPPGTVEAMTIGRSVKCCNVREILNLHPEHTQSTWSCGAIP